MPASDLLELAVEAHGGLDRWRSAAQVKARLRAGGLLFSLRQPWRARVAVEALFSTNDPYAAFMDYPRAHQRGVLAGDSVKIQRGDDDVLAERPNARATISRPRHKLWWDRLDGVYFRAYAMWNYVSTPFIFTRPGFELREGAPLETGGELWRRLDVRFPDDIPTHCRHQTFYFDERGWLRRHDYTAEVVYRWATASHFCYDHKQLSGILVPTRRRVVPRLARQTIPGPTLVWIRIDDFELVPGDSGGAAHRVI